MTYTLSRFSDISTLFLTVETTEAPPREVVLFCPRNDGKPLQIADSKGITGTRWRVAKPFHPVRKLTNHE